MEDVLNECVRFYESHFGSSPTVACCAPGRVNLIGEHTDYNDGFVFPMVSRKKRGFKKIYFCHR